MAKLICARCQKTWSEDDNGVCKYCGCMTSEIPYKPKAKFGTGDY